MEPLLEEANDDDVEDDNKATTHLRWNTVMDQVLVDTLLKQLELGNKGENGWKPCAYSQVRRNMRKKLGIVVTGDHIRNRLKTWKVHYVTITKCLEHNGFQWDQASKMLTAPDSVWSAYLQKNPKAAVYRMKCIPNFKDISRVMGNGQVIDALTRTVPENVTAAEKDEGSQIGGGIEYLPNEVHHITNGRELGFPIAKHKHKQQPTSSSSTPTRQGAPTKRKREEGNSEPGMVEIMGSLAEGIQRIASAMEDKKPVDLSSLVQELSKIPDFSDELVIEASEFLASDDKWARLFFALSGDQRKSWLMKRLGH